MISLVIPAYNEEKRLTRSIQDFKAFFRKIDIEIIIVVEKSKDNTLQIARELTKNCSMFKIIANDVHRGAGYAVKKGVDVAQGDYIFITDADIPIPLAYVLKFLVYMKENEHVDILLGNRTKNINNPPIRSFASIVFNFIVRNITKIKVTDTQCGFKAFRKKAAKNIFNHITCDNPAFYVEAIMLADKMNFKYEEMPVTWTDPGDGYINYKNIVYHSLSILFSVIKAFIRVKKMHTT